MYTKEEKKTNIPLSPESFFGDVSVKFLHIKYTRKYKAHKDQCNETTAIISILNGLPFPYMRQQCDGSVFPSTNIEIQIVIDANVLSEYTSISSIYSALLQSDSFLFCCGARSGYLLPLQILSIFTWPMPTAWSTPLFLFSLCHGIFHVYFCILRLADTKQTVSIVFRKRPKVNILTVFIITRTVYRANDQVIFSSGTIDIVFECRMELKNPH